MNGSIADTEEPTDYLKVNEELDQSIENLNIFSKFFPENYSYKFSIDENSSSMNTKEYLTKRLKLTDDFKFLCHELSELVQKIKDLDAYKGRIITSTIESLIIIIEQGGFNLLSTELEEIKGRHIELSSYRGGTLQELLERIEQKCGISKELEIIQAKIEAEQYIENLDSIPVDSQEFIEELLDTIEKRDNLENFCNLLEKENQEKKENEVDPILKEKNILENKIGLIQIKLNDLVTLKEDYIRSIKEISDLEESLKSADVQKDNLKEQLSASCKERENLFVFLKLSKKLKSKISSRSTTAQDLMVQLSRYEEESKIGFPDASDDTEKMMVMHELEGAINEYTSFSSNLSKNVDQNLKNSEEKLKQQIALRLFNCFKDTLERYFWK